MTDDGSQRRKQTAVRFLQLVVAGDIEKAYQQHVDFQGKHHNPYYPAGFRSLKQGMIENHVQFPHKRITVTNALADGDLVAVHSHLEMSPPENGMIVVHVFRFQGEKIVEMWDCGQPLPADSPNKVGTF